MAVLTDSVGRMQVVQALLADWLAVLLVFCREGVAHQRRRLGGDSRQRRPLYGLHGRARVDAAHCKTQHS